MSSLTSDLPPASGLDDASAGALDAERTLEVLDEIAALLAAEQPLEGLQEAAALLAEASGFSRCAVIAWPGEETIYLAAASEDASVARLQLSLDRYPELRLAFESRDLVLVSDALSSELLGKYRTLAAAHGGRGLLAVPVLAERGLLGGLLLRAAAPITQLDDRVLRLVRGAARLFALALSSGHILDSLRDQTHRLSFARYNEERRRRSIEKYHDFFESSADGVVVVAGDGEVLYVNRAAEQLTGYARSGLNGRSLSEIVAEPDRADLEELIRAAESGVQLAGFDLQLVTTSGEPMRVSVSTSAALVEEGAVVLSFRDVTVARGLEQELRKTKDFLERLIDSTVDGIVAADTRGEVIVFNKGAERIYGYSADEVIGILPASRLYPEGGAQAIMRDLRSDDHGGPGRLEPVQQQILTRDREVVPVLLTASIIYEDGVEIASVGVLSDLRERIHIEQRLALAQEKLQLSEKQALIAELAGTTAHELNQPLTSVMGYAELLKKRLPPGDPNHRTVDTILSEAERIAEIVRKIGRITRYEIKAYVGSTTILDLDKSTTGG